MKIENYEEKPRSFGESIANVRLPIKTKSGILVKNKRMEVLQTTSEALRPSSQEVKEVVLLEESQITGETIEECQPTLPQFLSKIQKSFRNVKAEIAKISFRIIEDPAKNMGQIKEILNLIQDFEQDLRIRKLAIVSALSIYKDVLPTYTIRKLTKTESKGKVSKEVKELRHFESTLLRTYQNFLNLLEFFSKKNLKKTNSKEKLISTDLEELSRVSVKVLCKLLIEKPNFNFRGFIINILVPFLNSSTEELRNVCLNCFSDVFSVDVSFEVSLEVVKSVAKFVKKHNYKVKPEVLTILLSLPLSKDFTCEETSTDSKKSFKKKKHEFRSRGKKKKDIMERKLEKELSESNAKVRTEDIRRRQTELLKLILSLYLRMLKFTAPSHLLSSVLKGLAKIAPLLNVDYFMALLKVLEQLLRRELKFEDSLYCLKAVFHMYSTQETSLLDLSVFSSALYKLLLELPRNLGKAELLINCLQTFLIHNFLFGINRYAGFVKRMAAMALRVPPNVALALLSLIYKIVQRNSKLLRMFDEEIIGCGVYLPAAKDPEVSNALSSSLLEELGALKSNPHSHVRDFANELIKRGSDDFGRARLLPLHLRKDPLEFLQIQ